MKGGTFLICANGKGMAPPKGRGKKKAVVAEPSKPCDYSRLLAAPPAEKASA